MADSGDHEASAYYKGERGRDYHELKHGVGEDAYAWVARARARKFEPHVRPHDVVLEFGVGTGWNIAALQCRRKIGVDVAETLRARLEQRGIEFSPSIEDVADASVDVVICHHVLEHLLEPSGTLEQLRRVLRPGGKLLLHVPYERERRYRKYRRQDSDRHLHSWNAQTLGNLVSDVEFEIRDVHIGPFGYDRFVSNLAEKAPIRRDAGELAYRFGLRLARAVRPVEEVCLVAVRP